MKTEFNPKICYTSNVLYNETLHRGFNRVNTVIKTGTAKHKIHADRFIKSITYLLNDNKNDFYEIQMAHKDYEPEYRCYLCKNGKKIAKNEKTIKATTNIMELIIDYVTKDLKQDIKGSTQGIEKRLEEIRGNKQFGEIL